MSMNNVNIVVFDQDQSSFTEQSRINYSNVRRATDPYASNQAQPVIINQITALNEKINALNEKSQKIQEYIKNSSNITNNSENSVNNSNGLMNSNQIQQLLRVVQLKIQIVIQETKKIMDKMTSEFDKKLSKTTAQKSHQMNSISKIQTHCRDTITKVEQNYQEQLNIVRSQHMQMQKKILQRVQQIQTDYKAKLLDFRNKQQEYVSTIQNLQNKLRVMSMSINNTPKNSHPTQPTVTFSSNPSNINTSSHANQNANTNNYLSQNFINNVNSPQNVNNTNSINNINMNKSKKVMEVTQQRPLSSLKSQASDNMSYMSSQQGGSTHQNLNDTSRRRTKIFEGRGSGKSVSPNNTASNKGVSPLKNQQNIKNDPKVYIKYDNPEGNKPTRSNQPVQDPNYNLINEAKHGYQNMTVKATVIPQNKIPQQQQSQQQMASRSQTERNLRNQQQNMSRQTSKRQIVPPKMQVQWQKFQDFNDQQDSGQSEDVFFYPSHEGENHHQPKSVFDYDQNNQSMHSPFDLN